MGSRGGEHVKQSLCKADPDSCRSAGGATEAMSSLSDNYDLDTVKLLGQGSDSTVQRAVERKSGEWHAIKLIRAGTDDPNGAREQAMMRRVQHPHVMKLLAYYAPTEARPAAALVMQEAVEVLLSLLLLLLLLSLIPGTTREPHGCRCGPPCGPRAVPNTTWCGPRAVPGTTCGGCCRYRHSRRGHSAASASSRRPRRGRHRARAAPGTTFGPPSGPRAVPRTTTTTSTTTTTTTTTR